MFFCEFNQGALDITVLLITFPFLEERLECGFEVECHGAEAGAFEVEIEIHVVFLLFVGLNVSLSQGLVFNIYVRLIVR